MTCPSRPFLTEVGNGIFRITEGTGVYAGATGSGTFSTYQVYTDSSLLFGLLDAEILGFVTLPISVAEPSTLMLFGTGFAWMLFGFTRRRCREIGSGEVGLSAILDSAMRKDSGRSTSVMRRTATPMAASAY